MGRSLTAANSVFYLTIKGVYSSPQKLQGYGTDAAWDMQGFKPVEVAIGVDGKKSSGFTPGLKEQTITLQADSASNDIFDRWYQAMQSAREDITCTGALRVPGIGKSYNLINGSLTGYPIVPSAGKTLKPRQYAITWEDITAGQI